MLSSRMWLVAFELEYADTKHFSITEMVYQDKLV